ncbi:ABC transporter substrate-binding protein, partial [Nocardia sp. NPDC058497]|uniref:ABC transporter substrate-binding protein n=1 Tax=Nocardia sp. NPDC058497 TaxID=3346529 RepID=UPI00365C65C9
MGFTRRQLLQSGLGATALLLAASCTSDEGADGPAKKGGTLRVGALGTAARIERDPHANLSNDSDFLIASLLYDALTVPGADPTVAPRLASHWEPSADNRRWTFTIADGAEFHNGAPVTADDVVWSMRRLRSVGGASKMPVAENDIAADGSHRVVFTLPAPNTQLPLLLRLMTFTVPQGTTHFPAGIGTGPFRLESYHGGNTRLVRNERWHGTPPRVDAIEVSILDSVTPLGKWVLGGHIDHACKLGA